MASTQLPLNKLDNDLKVVRDYLVLSGYQRSSLKGPIWSHAASETILEGPFDQPYWLSDRYAPRRRAYEVKRAMAARLDPVRTATVGSFDAILNRTPRTHSMSGVERLGLLLKYAAGSLRWHPIGNAERRGIPSGRALYTAELRLLIQNASGGADVFRYLPDEHALALVRSNAEAAPRSWGADVLLCIALHPVHAAHPYGEFCLSVSVPEAGVMSAQVAVLSSAVGWATHASTIFDDDEVSELFGLSGPSTLPATLIGITGDKAQISSDDFPVREIRFTERIPPADLAADYPFVVRMLEAIRFAAESAPPRLTQLDAGSAHQPVQADAADEPYPPPDQTDLLSVIRQRTSGRGVHEASTIGEPINERVFAQIVMSWSQITKLEPYNELRAVPLTPFVIVLNGEKAVRGLHVVDLEAGVATRLRDDLTASDVSGAYMGVANFDEQAMLMIVAADIPEVINRFGRRAFSMLLQAAGREVLHFCLLAARNNLTCRPMRSFLEIQVEQVLPQNMQMLMVALAGHGVPLGPSYDVY